jgi:GTPase SAR1 family protein
LNFIKNIENTKIVLCGNKTDLKDKREVEYSQAFTFAKAEGLMFFEVSAKTNDNIKKMFYSVVTELPFFSEYSNLSKDAIISEIGKKYF